MLAPFINIYTHENMASESLRLKVSLSPMLSNSSKLWPSLSLPCQTTSHPSSMCGKCSLFITPSKGSVSGIGSHKIWHGLATRSVLRDEQAFPGRNTQPL